MTKNECITSFKYSVLQHAYKHRNITNTFKAFNLSRTVCYKWLARFKQFGYLGLMDRHRSIPKMPNRIKPDKEQIIPLLNPDSFLVQI